MSTRYWKPIKFEKGAARRYTAAELHGLYLRGIEDAANGQPGARAPVHPELRRGHYDVGLWAVWAGYVRKVEPAHG